MSIWQVAQYEAMKTALTLDPAGRVVLPREVRRRFHLERGSKVEMEVRQDSIVLRPSATMSPLQQDRGLMVHVGEPQGDLVYAVGASRRRRDVTVSGMEP